MGIDVAGRFGASETACNVRGEKCETMLATRGGKGAKNLERRAFTQAKTLLNGGETTIDGCANKSHPVGMEQ